MSAKRLLSAQFGHETNTFAATRTTLEDFRLGAPDDDLGTPDSILRSRVGTRTIHGGFIEAAIQHGFDLVPLLATFAQPGGLILQDTYDFIKNAILDRIRNAGQFDGILLDLHGAMVTEEHEDAEGDLLSDVRRLVGREIPVVVTLDLHANITERMVEEADVLVGFDEYPHTDMFERGVEAVNILAGILSGAIRPTAAFRKLPFITFAPKQFTKQDPMLSLLTMAWAMEADERVVNTTVSMGFPYADIQDAGVSVVVTTNNDPELARQNALTLAKAVWSSRRAFDPELTPIPEVIDYVKTTRKGLTVLADGSDNPGGGGPADGTFILRQLIESDVRDAVVCIIVDPESVEQAIRAGIGNTLTLDIGGKTDDRHGSPVHATGYVRLISDGRIILQGAMGRGSEQDYGKAVVFVVGGVEIILTERRLQPYDAELLRSVGIEPTRRRLVVLKSAMHFRNTYQEIAERIFDADTPGIHSPNVRHFTYHRLRPGVYPVTDVPAEPSWQ